MNPYIAIIIAVLLLHLVAWLLMTAFMRGAHIDDDNAMGEEAANPTVIEKEKPRA